VEVNPGDAGTPPIGRPLPNTRAYVVDAHLNPVPVGVPGELLVGGVQLARGYWNRPELSAEKFIADPFRPGERLYRTGDLVRYLADGNIEFLGRIDEQVKIRGFRIELGEIESALSQHPAIREAVVLAREDSPGDKRLVAYLVAKGEAPSVSELKEFLARQLPHHMVPSAFVVLQALPLTPNGKVDRRALPAPDALGHSPQRPYVAPSGEIEERLAAIWAQLLGRERVSARDNFFELGGDSVGMVRMRARIQEGFGRELPIVELFRRPTIAALAPLFADEPRREGPAHARAALGEEPREEGRLRGDERLRAMRRRAELQRARTAPREGTQ
jgi:acyl carrier protein